MKIITNPEVYLIGKQMLVAKELDRFLEDHGITWQSDSSVASEVVTEVAGRTCYMSFAKPRPGGNHAYIEHIKEVGHGSVLEHAVWTFLVTGVSRSLTHELVRHRAGFAYSQLSQRYVDESDVSFIVPHDLQDDVVTFCAWDDKEKCWSWVPPEPGCLKRDCDHRLCEFDRASGELSDAIAFTWLHSVYESLEAYKRLANALSENLEPELAKRYRLDPDLNKDDPDLRQSELALITQNKTELRKAARQAARSVLPNATETKITVTANARAIRHFLEQRGSRHAEPEIRKLATAILDVVQADAPSIFGDYSCSPLPDGTCEITTPYRKV